MEEFIKLFGHFTVANVIELSIAGIFCYKVYQKFKDFFVKKAEEDMSRKQEVEDVLASVKKLVADREIMLANQNAMQEQLEKMTKAQHENAQRLTQLETSINNRERNKLRDRILQSYRYYTSIEHNPQKAWTKMEADAFWSLFWDYEAVDGNGYVHSVVQPQMESLDIISMEDDDAIVALMNSRK